MHAQGNKHALVVRAFVQQALRNHSTSLCALSKHRTHLSRLSPAKNMRNTMCWSGSFHEAANRGGALTLMLFARHLCMRWYLGEGIKGLVTNRSAHKSIEENKDSCKPLHIVLQRKSGLQ